MNESQGFWQGMPADLKGRLVFWFLFLVVALFVISQAPIVGIVLLVLPVLWTVLSVWFGGNAGMSLGPNRGGRETVLGYVSRHLWGASAFMRIAMSLAGVLLVVSGLAWLSTENMRAKAAELTLTERASVAAEKTTSATVDTTKGWFATAKGWFGADDNEE